MTNEEVRKIIDSIPEYIYEESFYDYHVIYKVSTDKLKGGLETFLVCKKCGKNQTDRANNSIIKGEEIHWNCQ